MVKKQIATELRAPFGFLFFRLREINSNFLLTPSRNVLACVCRIYSIDSTKSKVLLTINANVAISSSHFRCSILMLSAHIDWHWSLVTCSANLIDSNAIIFLFSPVMTYVGDKNAITKFHTSRNDLNGHNGFVGAKIHVIQLICVCRICEKKRTNNLSNYTSYWPALIYLKHFPIKNMCSA